MASIALQQEQTLVNKGLATKKLVVSIIFGALFSSVAIVWDDISAGTSAAKYLYFNLIIALVLLVVSACIIYRGRSISFKMGLTDLLLALFTFYILTVHVFFEKSAGFHFNNFIALLAAYFLLRSIFEAHDGTSYLEIGLGVFFSIASLEACYGILQLAGFLDSKSDLFSVVGSFHNPGPFGIYLAAPVVLAVAVLFNQPIHHLAASKPLKLLAACTVIVIMAVLPFTASRTAWISALGGIAYLLFQMYGHGKLAAFAKDKFTRLWLVVSMAALILVISIKLYHFKPASASGRMLIWTVAAPMTLKNPVWGLGTDGFQRHYGQNQAAYFSQHPDSANKMMVADQAPFAYNDYLQIGIEYGFVGLILLLALLISAWRNGSTFGKCLLLTCMISSMTSYAMQGLPTMFNLYLAIILCGLFQKPIWTISIKETRWTGAPLFCLSVFLLISTLTIISYRKRTLKAEMLFNAGRYDSSITQYQSLGSQLFRDLRSLSFYGKALAINNRHSEAIGIYEKAAAIGSEFYLIVNLATSYQADGDYEKAEGLYLNAIDMIPNRLYPKYLLAKLYAEQGEDDKAKALAYQVVTMKEKVPSLATREMKAHMMVYLDLDK
ncbi:O-antigen ligase family protein [Dyadobacter sp. LJ53]|uniref:O-antigen ligase family protein n=1 Tax=Dyadobacter chenwenxiniae TaxID=2906456 RepID=UPI001F46A4D9|nr:O-antigen ligase family protein [Dyadobacter chenwenxiniae]MCF0051673.1 O-antigen ligase family protein [Dyadobacter chenwenxiniae]